METKEQHEIRPGDVCDACGRPVQEAPDPGALGVGEHVLVGWTCSCPGHIGPQVRPDAAF
jgi:hypothetical protein